MLQSVANRINETFDMHQMKMATYLLSNLFVWHYAKADKNFRQNDLKSWKTDHSFQDV